MTDFVGAEWRESPNYWVGRQGFEVLYVVMHATDGAAPGCVTWLCDPTSAASVHYVVGRNGTVWQLVSEADSAWGNGIPEFPSTFLGGANPNLFTISIEHERTDGNTSPVTAAQQAASTALVADIRRRHGHIPLIPHLAISPQSRAHCPGPNFPMESIDQAASSPPPPAGVVRLAKPFSAAARRLPLVFYRDWSFNKPAYTSGAKVGTVLQFDTWAYGPAVVDAVTKKPDRRWYHRFNPTGACGWTPSAWLVGDAPESTP